MSGENRGGGPESARGSAPGRCIALSLPGGGLTGALYQIGALAALEDGVSGLGAQGFSLYVGQSSGAAVAAALAGGIPIDRLYRALLDPVDNFFPLERRHIYDVDAGAWQRVLPTGMVALRHAAARLLSRENRAGPMPNHLELWEQIDRLHDALPPGLFKLERFERFLAEFFLRRGIPNVFAAMPRPLRIATHDLDSGERVLFGEPGFESVPVSLACAASLALPPFFSPVRIGGAHYIDGGLSSVAQLDVAEAAGCDLAIVVSPLVPVATRLRAVPTGHGVRASVKDKGFTWIYNQAMRIGARARLAQEVSRAERHRLRVLVCQPEPTDAMLFLQNPASLQARRAILEYAYRTTRERVAGWLEHYADVAEGLGLQAREDR